MKKNLLLATFLLPLLAFAKVGVNTTTPAATLDVTARNATGASVEGLLIPRVDRLKAQTMTGVPTSTLIYVNNAVSGSQSGTAALIDAVGYYFFDGTVWTKLGSGSSTGVNIYNSDGTLTGNRIVTQNASTLAFTGTAANAFSVDANTFSVDAANDCVGIGTTSPQNKFHVVTTSPAIGRYSLIDAPVGTVQAPILALRNTSPSAAGNYSLLGFTNSGATSGGANGGIGTVVTANANQEDFFMANSIGGPYIDRFRVTYGGNVGINTSTPQRKLHVNGDMQLTNELNVGGNATTAGSAGTVGQILASAGPGAAPTWQDVSSAVGNVSWNILGNTGTSPATNFLGTIDNQDMVFRTNNIEKARITASGNVGIGTIAPIATTHIINKGTGGSFVDASTNLGNMGLRLENTTNGNAVIQHFVTKNSGGAIRQFVLGVNPQGSGGGYLL